MLLQTLGATVTYYTSYLVEAIRQRQRYLRRCRKIVSSMPAVSYKTLAPEHGRLELCKGSRPLILSYGRNKMMTLSQGWTLVIGFGVLFTLSVMVFLAIKAWKDNHDG